MPKRDPVLTPELIKLLKIFIFFSLGLVLVFSFFDSYRANNSGIDRTFQANDSNRLYFMNVRSIYYDREVRRDAGMTLFRHGKRFQSDSQPTLNPVILINPVKDDAYIYFELKNGNWPILITAKIGKDEQVFEFSNGNNSEHFSMLQKMRPFVEKDATFELTVDEKTVPIWNTETEQAALKSVIEDYFRLLNQIN